MKYADVLSQDDLELLRGLPEVQSAQGRPNVSFDVVLPESIQQKLQDRMGLSVRTAPFRWMKGDTRRHMDTGRTTFQNTYLVYLTDGEGQLKLGEESYSMDAGTGFSFAEGTLHEVVGTNGTERLLLGPMSEQGLAVGGPTLLYIRQNGLVQEQSTDQISWSEISWPFSISGGFAVEFVNNLTLTSATNYFICNGDNITIGSPSLNPDGTRPVITITATNYPGLIQNGSEEGGGWNNVSVYNLEVDGTGGTLAANAGWIGAYYYARAADTNFIIGCSSNGPIRQDAGGIVGSQAGFDSGKLTIVGCTSSGAIGNNSGGIAGPACAETNSIVHIVNCSSSGTIGGAAGGIVGDASATNGATCSIENCYSTGTIGTGGGGIFGRFAGNAGTATATNCYSRGNIGNSAGGIFGRDAGPNLGSATATNCYTTGNIVSASGGGITGITYGTGSITRCYVSGSTAAAQGYIFANSAVVPATNYSEAQNDTSGWNSTNASATLLGAPSPIVGTTWVEVQLNQPYELANTGPSPYSLTTIVGEDMSLTYSESVVAGTATIAGVVSGFSTYSILSGGDPTITIDGTTGAISTTTGTPAATYKLFVRAVINPYSITTFVLTVTEAPPPPFTITANGATETVYIREVSGPGPIQQYSTDQATWNNITWPVYIENINGSPASNILKVLFTTDLTLSTENDYIVVQTDGIQIGDRTLRNDGTPCSITVDGVTGFFGFVQNTGGFSSIYVYNLKVLATNESTLGNEGGWVCGSSFGAEGGTDNYVVNCSSDGPIGDMMGNTCGGIVGSYAGSGSGATLYVYGCSSTGAVSQLGGGIVGQNAGESGGFVSCEQCWSTGAIGSFAGGIFGDYAGYGGSANAYACFSLGAIGGNGGGIYGRYAGSKQPTDEGPLNGQATATACFSIGNIDADGGGIFGLGAANATFDGGSTTAINSYSSGIVTTLGNGIYGTGKGADAIESSNCYVANATWTDIAANSKLSGVPMGSSVGSIWVSAITNTPYILNEYGYTPYGLTNINPSSQLVQVYLENVQPGESTSAPVLSGSFQIANVTDPTITIDGTTGVISTTAETPPGEYTLVIVFTGPIPFSVTTFALSVLAPPVPPTPSTTVEEQLPSSRGKGFDYHTLADIERGKRLILERLTNPNIRFKSYTDYNKYRMAMYASLKPNL